MEKTVLIYCVEQTGRILSIDGPWDEFAAANGGVGLEKENLIGKNLLSYIFSTGVAEAYRTMHRHLNDNRNSIVTFDYRCDGPSLRRDMRMVMEYTGEGIRYTSSVENISPLDPPVFIDYHRVSGVLVRMCSWCKKFKYPSDSDHWNELNKLFSICPPDFTISHGICPSCRNKVPFLNLGAISL